MRWDLLVFLLFLVETGSGFILGYIIATDARRIIFNENIGIVCEASSFIVCCNMGWNLVVCS